MTAIIIMIDLVNSAGPEAKARSHFLSTFWEQQQHYNQLKDKRQMRWHPLIIRFALNLKYISSNAYRAVGNFLALPSKRTLSDYTNVMSVETGLSCTLIERMKRDMKFESCTASEKLVGIMMDEVKIKSGLVFNKKTDKIVGFVDLGSINANLEAFQSSLASGRTEQQKPELAGSMLVLMVRMLKRPSFTFPIAQYPTSSLSGKKIYPIMWNEAIEALEINDLKVMSISCDGLSANRNFFKIARDEDVDAAKPYKTANPFDKSRTTYYFCDAPNLLKTSRNCFSNSFSHSHSRKLKVYFDPPL